MIDRLNFHSRINSSVQSYTQRTSSLLLTLFLFMSGCTTPSSDSLEVYTQFNVLMDSCLDCYQVDYEKALFLSTKAINLADSLNYAEGLAAAYRIQSIAFIKLGNSEEAIKSLGYAFESAEKVNDAELLGKCYQTKGYIQIELGNLLEGLDASRRSLAYYEEEKNDRKIVEVYCNIGNTYYLDGDYKNAIKYMEKALFYSKKCAFDRGAAAALLNLGAAYKQEKDYEKALYSFELSLKFSQQLENVEQIIINYINLSVVNRDFGKIEVAQYWLNQADSINKRLKNSHLQIRVLRCHAQNFLVLEQAVLAKQYLDSAYKISQELEYPVYNLEFDLLYGQLFHALDEDQHAYKSLMKYIQFSDSTYAEKGKHRIVNLEQQREFEQTFLRAENQRNMTLWIGLLLLVVSISVFLFFLHRMRMKNRIAILEEEKSRIELEKKQVDLVSREIHLSEKKALLNRLLTDLVQIQNSQDCPSRVGEIISMLKVEGNTNNWDDFDIRFKELHSDFFAKLSKQFPNLSSYDKRLCAYLRMNLSTKEIAAITHQNPMSLNTARTRLRKKLNLTQTNVNLNDFMSRL